MRLFVALEVPRGLRDEVFERARRAQAGRPKARWVRPEAMHLTLSFLGETGEGLLPALDAGLEPAAAALRPFELHLDGLGAFPPRGKARVLWVGFAAPAALLELQKAVAKAVEQAAGIAPERRPFHPHLTLARLKDPWGRGSVQRFVDAFGEPPPDVFRVEEGVLFQSELHPSGARYTALRRYRFAGTESA